MSFSSGLCDYCGDTFINTRLLTNHIRMHTDQENNNIKESNIIIEKSINRNKFKCSHCTTIFPNKGLLSCHILRTHPKNFLYESKGNLRFKYRCDGCHYYFQCNAQLQYHIRKCHFNLQTETPYRGCKNIKEVWYEKVLNMDVVVQLKKVTENHLLIQRTDEGTSITEPEMKQEVIDLRLMYPTHSQMQMIQCNVCSKQCLKKELIQHFAMKHRHLSRKKCNQCNLTFKRPLNRMLHICRKINKGFLDEET